MLAIRSDDVQGGDFAARRGIREQARSYRAVFQLTPSKLTLVNGYINNELCINTRRYLWGADYASISAALEAQLLAEEQELAQLKQSLHHMEEEMFKRLWQMGRGIL